MLPLSPIIFHTTDSMLDRPSCVTAADNNKKEKRKKKKEHTSHRWSKPLAFRNQFNFALVETCSERGPRIRSIETAGKSCRLMGSALIQMEEGEGNPFSSSTLSMKWGLFDWSLSLHSPPANGCKLSIDNFENRDDSWPCFLHSLYFDPNSLFREEGEGRGIKRQTSLILPSRCRDNLFIRSWVSR